MGENPGKYSQGNAKLCKFLELCFEYNEHAEVVERPPRTQLEATFDGKPKAANKRVHQILPISRPKHN